MAPPPTIKPHSDARIPSRSRPISHPRTRPRGAERRGCGRPCGRPEERDAETRTRSPGSLRNGRSGIFILPAPRRLLRRSHLTPSRELQPAIPHGLANPYCRAPWAIMRQTVASVRQAFARLHGSKRNRAPSADVWLYRYGHPEARSMAADAAPSRDSRNNIGRNNIGDAERVASIIGGAALVVCALA